MSRLRNRTILLASLFASARAATLPLALRQNGGGGGGVCGVNGFSQCGGDLDEGLCCKSGETCISLAGGSTVLCCPNSDCNRIMPITCNINAQNPDAFPNAPLKTTALRGDLPRCGSNCCPFGFSCNDDGECDMDEDQSERPSELPASVSQSTTALPTTGIISPTFITTTSEPTATTSQSPSGSDTTSSPTSTAPAEEQQEDNQEEDAGFPTAAVVVGVIAGVLFLVAIVIGIIMCRSRRRRQKNQNQHQNSDSKKSGLGLCRTSTSTSSFGNIISDPIPKEGSDLRTDFILKSPAASRESRSSQGLSSLFRRDTSSFGGTTAVNGISPRSPPRYPARTLSNATMTTSNHNNLAIPPIRTMRNQQKPTINKGSAWQRGPAARAAALDATTPTDATRPVTPKLQREPSSESINVFADPGTVASSRSGDQRQGPVTGGLEAPRFKRNSAGTTFTDLMEEAELGDVRRGKPFVPYTPGRSPLR